MGVVRTRIQLLVVLGILGLAACGSPITGQPTVVPMPATAVVQQATSAPAVVAQPTEVQEIATPSPVPPVKVLDWSFVDELQGSTFEFFTSTHVPENTQPFTGWYDVLALSSSGSEQPKGSLAVSSDTDPQTYVSVGGDSMLVFVTCRELNQSTGRSANNKRTLIFAVLEGSHNAFVVPDIITAHSFSYRGDQRVDWGEQFKLLGNQGHPEDQLWPAEGAFVLHLANGQTLRYNYVAGLNVHYPDDSEISPFAVIDTKTAYAGQLQELLNK